MYTNRRRDVKRYDPPGGTDIRDAIEHVVKKCQAAGEPIELIHNDNHIIVLPTSSVLDIYGEWCRQQEMTKQWVQVGREQHKSGYD